ncbi:MAG TPA: hypothetical protein VM364_03750 [Vicinamibacterales bacterium]|nr:hypothetical protein [Vicinamibacterales bacterium]
MTCRMMACAAGVLVALAASATAQERTAPTPHERMAFLEGTWELEPGGKPESIAAEAGSRETCAWLAGARRHIVCRAFRESAAGRQESMHVLSYDAHAGKYVAWFAFAGGETLHYVGSVDGDRWVMEMQPTPLVPAGLRLRTIITPTANGMRFVEEGSKDGGPWEIGEDYRHKRVSVGDPPSATPAKPSSSDPTKGPSRPRDTHEPMAFFQGAWEFETATTPEVIAKRSGRRETCDWLTGGRRHMVCLQRSRSAEGVEQESIYIISYRQRDSTYVAWFAIPGGQNVVYHGTPTADGWVMELQPTPLVPEGMRVRTTVTRTEGGLRFVDEVSMNGEPWRVTEDYRHRRVK